MGITRTPIVDDDGTETTGTIINNAWKTEFYDQIDAAIGNVSATTITTTGTQTALALPSGSGPLVIFANNASLLTLQGIAAGLNGQHLTLISIGAGRVDLAHQNASATAANRLINVATSGNTSLAGGSGKAVFVYDGTTARWRLVQHEQGAWITPTFASGDFTGSGSMTWTVAAGNVSEIKYRLQGKTLQMTYLILNSTIAGTPANALKIGSGQWGGFTASSGARMMAPFTNNGSGSDGVAVLNGTAIDHYVNSGLATAWTASAGNAGVAGMLAFEVN